MTVEFMSEYLEGFVDGEKYNIENTPEQIAVFIVKHRFSNVKIVSTLDTLLFTTLSGNLDYVSDQEYLHTQLLPILMPMQQGEVEAIEFIPYEIDLGTSVLLTKKDVELDGVKFDVTVTTEPYFETHYIHLLEIEGSKVVSDIIDATWKERLIEILNLPNSSSDYGYQIYCYCLEIPGLILEYYFDDNTNARISYQVNDDEPIWHGYLKTK